MLTPCIPLASQDYSAFKSDVARLQKNLDEFEADLKEHTMQVGLKLAYILSALDDADPVEQPNALGYSAKQPHAMQMQQPSASAAQSLQQPLIGQQALMGR